jgi:hypothetical protein
LVAFSFQLSAFSTLAKKEQCLIRFLSEASGRILPEQVGVGIMEIMHSKLKDAIALFNRREYFACHEVLEEIWHEAAEEDKNFYEGLIRFATGLHLRFNRRVPQGAINLLTQGLMRIENYRPTYHGVDVARLYAEIDIHLSDLKVSKSSQAGFFERWRVPRIHWLD